MITTLTGKNVYELNRQLNALRNGWGKINADSLVETYLAEDIVDASSFINELRTISLFAGQRLVILRYISSGSKDLHDLILKYGDDIPDDVHLVIYDPELDLRTKLAKWLKGHSDWIEVKEIDIAALRRWLGDEVKNRGMHLTSPLQAYLISRGVHTQTRLDQELIKLASYTSEITQQVIDELVVSTLEDDIFAFLDAFISGDRQLALQYLSGFEQSKMEPGYILNMIIWQINILAVGILSKTSIAEVSSQSGLSAGALRRAQSLKNTLSSSKLKSLIDSVSKIDAHFYESDNWQQLEILIINNT